MKQFDPDFSLRAYFQTQYAEVFNDPFLHFHVPNEIEDIHCTEVTWMNTLIQSPLEEWVDTFSPISMDSGATHSAILTSPSSTNTFESTTNTSPPVSTTISSAEPSRDRRKRQRSSEDTVLNDRCKLVRLPRLAAPKLASDKGKQPAVLPWAKSVLVRIKPRPNDIIKDLRYTFIKLPSPNVYCCAAAICTKMGIPFTKGMPVSWLHSETLLRGPFDQDFLQSMPDMQDFVIDLVEIGVRGDVGLILEM